MIDEYLIEQFNSLSQDELNKEFLNACKNGEFERVKYLLTSPNLKVHADREANKDGFCYACKNGHLEIVKYLLTSPDLIEHVNIHVWDDSGFRQACNNGHLHIVKYMAESPELKEHVNIHALNRGFEIAAFINCLDIIRYFILDLNIEKSEAIEKYLKNYSNEEITKMFKIRELNNKLDNDLNSTNISKTKIKI